MTVKYDFSQWKLVKGRGEGPWHCQNCREAVVLIQDMVSFKLQCGCMAWRIRPWNDDAIIEELGAMPG